MSGADLIFARGLSLLLTAIGAPSRGDALTSLIERVDELLSEGDVLIERDETVLRVNGKPAALDALEALHRVMHVHELSSVRIRATATARDLVHFAALCAGPPAANGLRFAQLWTMHGSWHIAVELEPEGVDADTSDPASAEDDVLERVARLIGEGASMSESTAAFGRLTSSGERATALLFGRLIRAETGAERRRYFDVLVRLDSGDEHLVAALSHPAWFAVRNAAALLGARAVGHAAEPLVHAMRHDDRRVRVAIVEALSALSGAASTEGLHTALADRSSDVRLAAWNAFATRERAPSATALNEALQHEPDLAVLQAIMTVVQVHAELPSPRVLVRCVAHLLSRGTHPTLACDALEILTSRQPQTALPLLRRASETDDDSIRLRVSGLLESAHCALALASAA